MVFFFLMKKKDRMVKNEKKNMSVEGLFIS